MKRSENIIDISKALNAAQKEMRPAIKDSTNPHFRSKYSDLASVMDALREPIGNNGLSIVQDATMDEKGVNITTTILHLSGQWIEFGPLTIPLGKKDAHAVGSACSYGKRYSLCAALGVVSDDDDDGNKAVASYKNQSHPKPNQNYNPDSSKMIYNDSEAPQEYFHEPIETVHKVMTNTQHWTEFNELLEQCSDKFKLNTRGRLQDLGLQDLSKMDMNLFEKFKKAMIEHIEKMRNKNGNS